MTLNDIKAKYPKSYELLIKWQVASEMVDEMSKGEKVDKSPHAFFGEQGINIDVESINGAINLSKLDPYFKELEDKLVEENINQTTDET